jgi:hypothetical protein
MQTAFKLEENKSEAKKAASVENVMLTSRDLEVISFIHEMKFATIEDVHFKFFRKLKDGTESKSMWWARERLTLLQKHNFLGRVYSFNERKAYFLGTKKGFMALVKKCPSKWPVRPLEKIDFKTFDHDKLVMELRLKLEASGEACSWISDRQLFQFPELCLNLGEGNQPDAIYENAKGEKVAFELEIARKTKKRYLDKIRTYVFLMREQKDNPKSFKKVHFVVASEAVYELILSEVKIYPQYFTVQLLDQLK